MIGHSSGAHIVMMAALKGLLSNRVDALIGMSGVYDLELVCAKESRMGLVGISPLDPTSRECLKDYYPSWLSARAGSVPTCTNIGRAETDQCTLSPILLLHGEDDTVALPVQ